MPRKYTTSSIIRKRIEGYNANTFYSRLERLIEEGYVKKRNRKNSGKEMTPGGDKTEYILTRQGGIFRTALIKRAQGILDIPNAEKK